MTTRIESPLRVGTALTGVLGVLALAGCTSSEPSGVPSAGSNGGSDADPTSYADGTYTAEGSYQTPESMETVEVTVTLADGVVTAVEVKGDPERPESGRYQTEFIGGIDAEVIGVPIDDLNVNRVAGSSLTSGGFNSAIAEIKQEAVL